MYHNCELTTSHRADSTRYVMSGFLWVCLSARLSCFEEEGETLTPVILKTGYRGDECWIDKACGVNTKYTNAGNRLLVLCMQTVEKVEDGLFLNLQDAGKMTGVSDNHHSIT